MKTMKFIYKFTALAGLMAALPFMSSCKDDNESFVTASRLSIAVSTESDFKNRSVIEGGTLPDGSVIGLSLVDADGVGYGDKDYGLFTATSSTGTQTQKWSLSEDVILDGNKGTLYGFYPYSDVVTDIKSIPVVSGNTDYMYAIPVEDLDGNHPTAGIVMKHALTAVRVSLALGTYPGQGVVSSMVISGDLAGNAVLDATTGALTGLGGLSQLDITPENPVTLTSEPYSFTGLVIPTAETGKLTVCVTVDGTPLTSTLSSCDLTAGNLLNINATLNGKELVVSSVTIDEWQGTTSVNVNEKYANLLVAMYNVTSTTDATKILDTTSGVSKMFIDGVEMSPTTSYRFSSTGEHVVEFALANENEIAVNTFSGCKQLTGVYIPENLVKIGNYAFWDCEGLTGELIIPNSVTSIGNYAFNGCAGLTALELGTGMQTIGERAFRECTGLTGELVIPNSVTNIGNYAFWDCEGLTSLNLGAGVRTIGNGAFSRCTGLTGELKIPDSVTSIEEDAFSGCAGLTALELGTGVQTIGNYAFSSCSGLTNIIIPNSVTSIGNYAFLACTGLTAVNISNSVTNIGSCAFCFCFGLTALELGSGVQTIGNAAFEQCTGLTSITSKATTAPSISAKTFYIVKSAGTLFVPAGATGYDTWMQTSSYYLGFYDWTLQEYTPTEGLAFE